MATLPSCLDTVVGLSATECSCFVDGDEPAGYNTSLSGLYLDDPEYGFPLKIPQSVQQCSENDLWARLEEARTLGIQQFITDLGANMIGGPMKTKTQPFTGYVGDDAHSLNLSPSTYFALRLEPKIFRGVVAKLTSITLYARNVEGQDVHVEVYDEAALTDQVPLFTFDIPITGNKGTYTFDTTEQIWDFQSEANQERDLYLVINAGNYAGIQPRNNKTRCSCGKKEKWDQFFYANGLTSDTLEGLVDASESTYAYGFRLQLSVACGNSWLCQQFDFVNDPWARVMAECIALYGMKKLAGMILTNPYPEKYTMITREEIAFHRDRINTLLGQRMPWLAGNLPHYYQDCFACNDKARAVEYLV
jgi:hypothetical protein